MPRKKKTPQQSATETRYILAPNQVNTYGTAFGGVIMSWIDMVGAMTAQRHCEGVVVTVSIDSIAFKAPIYMGDHVILQASVNYVGTTSMEVGVKVTRENPLTGERIKATTAYLTFVHLDEKGAAAVVPELRPVTPDDERRLKNATHRVEARRQLFKKLQ